MKSASIMRTWVRSLALFSGLRIWHCHKLQCRSQSQLRSQVVVAMTQAAVAPVQPPAWELPYATGAPLKRQKKTYYIYNGIYSMESYSVIKKKECCCLPATWMQPESLILSEVSQKEKDKYRIWYHLYVESKIWHKRTYLQNRNRFTDIENRLVVAKGKGEEVGWTGRLGWLMQTITFRMDRQWGPTVQHRELYPVSGDGR